jgi:hypothetical protein
VGNATSSGASPDGLIWASSILGSALGYLTGPGRRNALNQLSKLQGLLPKQDLGVVYTLARLRIAGERELAMGNTSEALRTFRRVGQIDAPLSDRDYLGRALVAAAAHEHSAERARALLDEAMLAYGRVATRPSVVWRQVWNFPPGFVSADAGVFVTCAYPRHRRPGVSQSRERSEAAAGTKIRIIHSVQSPENHSSKSSKEEIDAPMETETAAREPFTGD